MRFPIPLIPETTQHTSPFPWRSVIGLLLLFWCAFLPFSANYFFYHPDERHYTDAGIMMVQSGDYLTPQNSDGTPRFLKPILTYWLVAASFNLFGITIASARIPFLIVGGACLLLGSLLAHRIFKDRQVTLLATAMLSVNPLLIQASLSTLPDGIQCFCLLLSLYGWIGLLEETPSRSTFAIAILGAGLAVATKGIPGILLTLYSPTFIRFNPWVRVPFHSFFSWTWSLIGCLIGGGWYLTMWILHGESAMRMFLEDQIQSRIVPFWWRPLLQLPGTILMYGVILGPSVCILGWMNFRKLHDDWCELSKSVRARIGYALGWGGLLIPLFSFVSPFTFRYFQLVMPLFTILFAWCIVQGAPAPYRSLCRIATPVLLVSLILMGAFRLAMTELGHFPVQPLIGLLFTCISGSFLVRWINSSGGSFTGATKLATHGLQSLAVALFWILSPLNLPDQSAEMSRFLKESRFDPAHHEVWYIGKPALGSKLRLAGAGQLQFHTAEANTLNHLPSPKTVIISQERISLSQLNPQEYLTFPISEGWKDLSPVALFRAWSTGHLVNYVSNHRERMTISVHRSGLKEQTITLPIEADKAHRDFLALDE